MAVTGPPTGFLVTDPNTGNTQDLGNRYVSKSYLLDVYPNMVPGRTVPGLWACGYNTLGQLGNGTVVNYSSPIQIGSLTNWKQVVCGGTRSHAIKTDGTLWSWGGNREGEIGNGTSITTYSSPIQVGLLTNWKQVAAGNQVNSLSGGDFFSQTLAVKTDGTLWAWGNNGYGALGNGTTTPYSSPIQIGALTNWKQVACGYATFAIKTDGTLWAWGYNLVGGLGNGNTVSYSSPIQIGSLTNWKQVASSETYDPSTPYFNSSTFAVKTDGTLWGWGDNTCGQLGNQTNSNYYSSPIQIGSLTNWKQVSCGYSTVAAIKTDGTLWAWGSNYYGQLGNGTVTYYSSPIQVGSLTNWKSVACGFNAISAIKTDGTLWTWGYNAGGKLGNGTTTSYSSPIQVGSLTTWKSVYMVQHMLAIADGYI